MKKIVSIHAAIRRNLYWLEHLILAAGFTFLLSELINASRVYPLYWDTVLLGVVFLLMLTSPIAGYFVFVLASVYPIAHASIYLAVFVLAIALIGQYWFTRNLGLLLFVLFTPFLNGIYLAWLAPLLIGLWWGSRSGLLGGALSALWTKLLFGLAGISADYLQVPGLYPNPETILARFTGINSLQMFQLPLQLLAPDSTTALYHVLQITVWGFCGWSIGHLSQTDKVQYHRPRTTIGLLTLGIGLLSIVHFGLAIWLTGQSPTFVTDIVLISALPSLAISIISELLVYFFERPLPYAPISVASSGSNPAPRNAHPPAPKNTPESRPDTDEVKENSDNDPMIMIELD